MNWPVLVLILTVFATCYAEKVIPVMGKRRYSMNYWQAHAACKRRGGSLATVADMKKMKESGEEICACGWLADRTARYPMNTSISQCGGKPGVHICNFRDTYDAFCYLGNVRHCNQPLGMEDGSIGDYQLSAPSAHHNFFNQRWLPRLARLNKQGVVNAWMPHHDDTNQYLQIDLGTPKAITGIMTQGVRRYLNHQYITQFKISYSKDGDTWVYKRSGYSQKIFKGNHDNNSVVRNMFDEPFTAKFVRIYPHRWVRHISLRAELLGCSLEEFDEARNTKLETIFVTE